MGAPAEVLDQLAPAKQGFEIFPENLEAIQLFMRLQTQWVIAGMGGVVGLNYQSVEFLFRLYKVKNREEIFADLQDIESGALAVMSKKAKGN